MRNNFNRIVINTRNNIFKTSKYINSSMTYVMFETCEQHENNSMYNNTMNDD